MITKFNMKLFSTLFAIECNYTLVNSLTAFIVYAAGSVPFGGFNSIVDAPGIADIRDGGCSYIYEHADLAFPTTPPYTYTRGIDILGGILIVSASAFTAQLKLVAIATFFLEHTKRDNAACSALSRALSDRYDSAIWTAICTPRHFLFNGA